MVTIASRRLGHLCHQCLGVTQQQMHHRPGAIKLLHQQLRFEPVTVTARLHGGLAGCGMAAHEKRYAEHALIAHARDLGGCAIFHHIMQGNDGGGRKIHVLQLAAGFAENRAERHLDQLKMRGESLEYFRRQGCEKVVLLGGMLRGHNSDHFLSRKRASSNRCITKGTTGTAVLIQRTRVSFKCGSPVKSTISCKHPSARSMASAVRPARHRLVPLVQNAFA
jgi:hypothetical protein